MLDLHVLLSQADPVQNPYMVVQVFEILVQGLFDPLQHLPAETQRTYVQLLATAASASDERSKHLL